MNRPLFWPLVAVVLLVSSVASARVRHDGAWPAQEKTVSLSMKQTPRADAVRKLAEIAGWNLVIHAPKGDLVDVEVKDEAPSKILDILLTDRGYVATRDGRLVSIEIDDAAAPEAAASAPAASAPAASAAAVTPPTPPAPPTPAPPVASADEAPAAVTSDAETHKRTRPVKDGEDRKMAGANLRIEKHEVVHDVVVFGGNVDIYGTVTGDISVTGGNVHVRDSGWIIGDASVVGGNLTMDGDSTVDGDVSVVGGTLKRSESCKIGGSIESKATSDHDHGHGGHALHAGSILGGIGGAITRGAMLFVFGAVLLALAAKRMETLRVEVVARPMRSFAMGVVGVLGGLVLFIAFCVTIIGIPIALVGLFLGILGGYAGVCAVLTVVGQALLKHKTESPYVHLAVGCALFIVVGAIPFIGTLVTIAVALVGVGVLVATRAAGLVQKKNGVPTAGPYRTAEA